MSIRIDNDEARCTDLGHALRLQLWAELGAVEVYLRAACRDQEAGITTQRTQQLVQLDQRAHDLWDALAAAQAL